MMSGNALAMKCGVPDLVQYYVPRFELWESMLMYNGDGSEPAFLPWMDEAIDASPLGAALHEERILKVCKEGAWIVWWLWQVWVSE